MKVLLHICCAPCTIYPLGVLRAEGHEVTGYFYNPNIHPYTEFTRRLDAVEDYAKGQEMPLVVDDEYDLEAYLRGALNAGSKRCSNCYRVRLEKAFQSAQQEGAEAITSTLLYSKYQRHAEIVATALMLAEEYEVPFFYTDFREGWKEGQDESRRLGIYRQKYCGCIFSEMERYRKNGG